MQYTDITDDIVLSVSSFWFHIMQLGLCNWFVIVILGWPPLTGLEICLVTDSDCKLIVFNKKIISDL